MAKIRNKSTVPQGMLAPNGFVDTAVNPAVQATTRPPGMLLAPSPGYDSVRAGKDQFGGKGPRGGFRRMDFAEDVGAGGAALSVVPGDVAGIAATEWPLGEPGVTPEGTVLIADRSLEPGFSRQLHEGQNTLPDMGDRTPDRPLSQNVSRWVWHPAMMFKDEWRQKPAVAVAAAVGFVVILTVVADDLEKEYRARRGRGITGAAETPPAASRDVVDTGVEKISSTAESAVNRIEKVTEDAVNAISQAGTDAANAVKSAAS